MFRESTQLFTEDKVSIHFFSPQTPSSNFRTNLLHDVLVGVVQPLVEGDEAVAILVHGLKVLTAFGKSHLNGGFKANISRTVIK